MLEDYEVSTKMQDMLRKWRSAARMRPLFISNHGTDSLTGTSHPAIMALHLDQARIANQTLVRDLEIARQERANAVPGIEPIAVASGPN